MMKTINVNHEVKMSNLFCFHVKNFVITMNSSAFFTSTKTTSYKRMACQVKWEIKPPLPVSMLKRNVLFTTKTKPALDW